MNPDETGGPFTTRSDHDGTTLVRDDPGWAGICPEEIQGHIASHIEAESAAAASYEAFAAQGDSTIRLLTDLISADELRHHDLMNRIAADLVERASGSNDCPGHVLQVWPHEIPALLEATRHLLAMEREDELALAELRSELLPTQDLRIWPLLAAIMAADTRKHILILREIERLLLFEAPLDEMECRSLLA